MKSIDPDDCAWLSYFEPDQYRIALIAWLLAIADTAHTPVRCQRWQLPELQQISSTMLNPIRGS